MEIGKIEVYLLDKIIHTENLYIKKQEKTSFFNKIIRWIKNDK